MRKISLCVGSQIASRIIRVFSKREAAEKLGEKGFETAKKCYLKKGARSLLNVFSEVLGK